jgi:hypothetical protein
MRSGRAVEWIVLPFFLMATSAWGGAGDIIYESQNFLTTIANFGVAGQSFTAQASTIQSFAFNYKVCNANQSGNQLQMALYSGETATGTPLASATFTLPDDFTGYYAVPLPANTTAGSLYTVTLTAPDYRWCIYENVPSYPNVPAGPAYDQGRQFGFGGFSNDNDFPFHLFAQLEGDPSVVVSATHSYREGASVFFDVLVDNSGAEAATVRIINLLPAQLSSPIWTCAASGSATCTTDNGTGNIDVTESMPAGSTLEFVASGVLPSTGTDLHLIDLASVDAANDTSSINNFSSATIDVGIFGDGFDTD